eukprot:6188436-Pleurochrysis_carterae.AAC.5
MREKQVEERRRYKQWREEGARATHEESERERQRERESKSEGAKERETEEKVAERCARATAPSGTRQTASAFRPARACPDARRHART